MAKCSQDWWLRSARIGGSSLQYMDRWLTCARTGGSKSTRTSNLPVQMAQLFQYRWLTSARTCGSHLPGQVAHFCQDKRLNIDKCLESALLEMICHPPSIVFTGLELFRYYRGKKFSSIVIFGVKMRIVTFDRLLSHS
jgi:hypothetical protein